MVSSLFKCAIYIFKFRILIVQISVKYKRQFRKLSSLSLDYVIILLQLYSNFIVFQCKKEDVHVIVKLHDS